MVNVEGLGPVEVDDQLTTEQGQAMQTEVAAQVAPVIQDAPKAAIEQVKQVPQGEETLTSFQHKVDQAKLQRIGFVETTEAIFNYYCGGQDTPFFWYQNIKVFKYGERQAIEAFDNLPLEERARQMMVKEANKPK